MSLNISFQSNKMLEQAVYSTIPSLTVTEQNIIQEYLSPEISVIFKKGLNRSQLIKEIERINEPQVCLFYIGDAGFREEGANYYKKDLQKILYRSAANKPVSEAPNEPRCWLYDLTAWASLCNRDKTIDLYDRNVDVINNFAIPRILSFKSSDFFKWLQQENNQKIIDYFNQVVLKRNFIFSRSQSKDKPTNIKVAEIFKGNCKSLALKADEDCGEMYSAIQYIEGLYLVDRIIGGALQRKDCEVINIVFSFPKDEFEYYEDQENSFAKDLLRFLVDRYGKFLNNRQINVIFCTLAAEGKPYKSGKKIIDGPMKREQLI